MKNIIGLKELRNNLDKYANAVAKGKSFIVAKKSKPIFRISPADEEDGWETVVDFTKAKKRGMPTEEVIERLKKQLSS